MPTCDHCKKEVDEVFRLVLHPESGYDAVNKPPVYLCKDCSKAKFEELKARGFNINPDEYWKQAEKS